MVAAVVYAAGSAPIHWWPLPVAWLALLALLAFLMVSTWRYYSFKGINLLQPRSPLMVIVVGSLIYLIWNYSQLVLLAMAATYVASGIVIRIGGIVRRRLRPPPSAASRSTRLARPISRIDTVPWSAANRCSAAKSATWSPPPISPRIVSLVAAGRG